MARAAATANGAGEIVMAAKKAAENQRRRGALSKISMASKNGEQQ